MAFNKTAEGSSMKRRPMRRRKKVCVFCGKDNVIDYKDINKLKRYISEKERSFLVVSQETVQSIRELLLLLSREHVIWL